MGTSYWGSNLSSLIRDSQAVPFELKQFDEMWIRAILFLQHYYVEEKLGVIIDFFGIVIT